jgi:hypothetical protein
VVDPEDVVVDDALREVESPQPTSIHPTKARPLIAHRQSVVRRERIQGPAVTADRGQVLH